jgi:hypothetical protein
MRARRDPHVVEHPQHRRQRLVQNSSSRSRSSGVNSIRARLSATDHARVRVVPWVGWVLMVVSPWSPRSADVTTIRRLRLGVPQGGAGLDRGLSRHGNGPGRPRRLGFHGTAVRPIMFRQRERDIKGMISRRPRPGRISPPKAVVSSPRATDGNPRLDSMVRAASKARTRWPLICGFRCPAEDPSHEGVPEVGDPEVHVRVVGQRGGEPEAGKRGDDHLERLGRVAAVGGRVGQRVDHLGPVPERLGPAVGADQWDRVRPTPRRRMKCTGTPSTWTR